MNHTLRQVRQATKFTFASILVATLTGIGCHMQQTTAGLLPGALPYYPDYAPAATRGHVGARKFDWTTGGPGRWIGNLECHTVSDCDGISSVRFEITAEQNARTTAMRDALTGPFPQKGGYIVARLVNLDQTHRYGPFGMRAKDTTYLWVGPSKAGSKRFGLYRIPGSGTIERTAHANSSNFCPAGTKETSDIHAPPMKCEKELEYIYGPKSGKSGEPRPFARLASIAREFFAPMASMSHSEGLWISCSGGCCEAAEWEIN